ATIQSGFKRLQQLNLLEWTIEAAVTKFPSQFGRHARECAEWRLAQVKKKPSARGMCPQLPPAVGPKGCPHSVKGARNLQERNIRLGGSGKYASLAAAIIT